MKVTNIQHASDIMGFLGNTKSYKKSYVSPNMIFLFKYDMIKIKQWDCVTPALNQLAD